MTLSLGKCDVSRCEIQLGATLMSTAQILDRRVPPAGLFGAGGYRSKYTVPADQPAGGTSAPDGHR
jgi:hypothetical protein